MIPCVQPISRVVYESSDEDEIPCAQPISRVGYETSSDEDSQSTSASSQNIFQLHAQPLYDPNDSFEKLMECTSTRIPGPQSNGFFNPNALISNSSDENILFELQNCLSQQTTSSRIPRAAQPATHSSPDMFQDTQASQTISGSSENIFQQHAQPLFDPNDSFENSQIQPSIQILQTGTLAN